MGYIVEREMVNGQWQAWGEDDGTPTVYAMPEQAAEEIRDHIIDCINEVEGGEMEDSPDPSEFRIVEFNA